MTHAPSNKSGTGPPDFQAHSQPFKLSHNHYHAWIELHIEQGPLLEREGIPLGIVTSIAAPFRLSLHNQRFRRSRRCAADARSQRRPSTPQLPRITYSHSKNTL